MTEQSEPGSEQLIPVAKCPNCGYIYGDDLDYRFPNPSVCEKCGEETENTTMGERETVESLAGEKEIATDGGQPEPGLGRCDTEDCHREAVVTHSYLAGHGEREAADLCLPCRRVIEHARGIPWNDETEEWTDPDALQDFNDGGNVDRRSLSTDTDQS